MKLNSRTVDRRELKFGEHDPKNVKFVERILLILSGHIESRKKICLPNITSCPAGENQSKYSGSPERGCSPIYQGSLKIVSMHGNQTTRSGA